MTSRFALTANSDPQTGDSYIVPENRWLFPTLQAFVKLPWENDNWSSDGQRTNPTAVVGLIAILVRVGDDRMPPPYIIPAWNGGVQAEWHRNNVDLEIDVAPDGVAEFFFKSADGQEGEKNAWAHIDELTQYVQEVISADILDVERERAYRQRMSFLQQDAQEYGIAIDERSQNAFWDFVRNTHTRDEASLTLPDNGRVNALWGSRKGSYVWAEFHDDNNVWIMENTAGEATKGIHPAHTLAQFMMTYERNNPR